MIFAVAGAALLLALAVGTVSHLTVPFFEKDNKENIDSKDESTESEVSAPAAAGAYKLSEVSVKGWCIIVFSALIFASAIALSFQSGVTVLNLVRFAVLGLILLASMQVDRKIGIIPNLFVFGGLIICAVLTLCSLFYGVQSLIDSLITTGVGLVIMAVLFYLMSRLTRNGVGMGDVKLIALMGAFVGLYYTLAAVLFSLFICAAFSVVLLIGKLKSKNDSIPFGPFLFFGYILMLILFNL